MVIANTYLLSPSVQSTSVGATFYSYFNCFYAMLFCCYMEAYVTCLSVLDQEANKANFKEYILLMLRKIYLIRMGLVEDDD